MRITLRLIVSLAVVVAAVALSSAYLQVRWERIKQQEELERRSRLVAESLQESIEPLLEKGPTGKGLSRLVEKFGNRERLAGVAVYDLKGGLIGITSSLSSLAETPKLAMDSLANKEEASGFDRVAGKEMHLYILPLTADDKTVGALVLFNDARYIEDHLSNIWRRTFGRVLLQVVLISIVTLLVVRWSIAGPIARTADWMRRLRAGESVEPFILPKEDMFAPLAKEVRTFAHHLATAQRTVEEHARQTEHEESFWTPERLKEHVRGKLGGKPLFIVSNREPYMHVQTGKTVEAIVPAAGLVTALDPVLRACGGTWIAHGSGDGDWTVVDENDCIRVPEDDPRYILRRVALTKEEEAGYYYGFSNEGLWPMCLMTHTRPVFREADWRQYEAVNRKFAEVTLAEIKDVEEPYVLIQDYQFALLPRLIKRERPDARVAIFWHIPWPNSEAFGICPWQKELLYGMLGADLVGFHTQFFCNNFMETVDRSLESRIRWESFSVEKEGHRTVVKPFPVSVCYPQVFPDVAENEAVGVSKADLLRNLGVRAERFGIGVERIDYTKGLLERFAAIERFFEKYPNYVGKFTFVELGAPSRTHIKSYHDFMAQVETEVDRINWKFKGKDWRPIVLVQRHHSHREILPFYRAADLCMVTSLHDGMNLVAKEFVAARSDETGTLILSRFAGAASELRDALIVNPYDIERMADAIRSALEMPKDEQLARMRRLRQTVREHNIYRWAGSLVGELSRLRVETPQSSEARV